MVGAKTHHEPVSLEFFHMKVCIDDGKGNNCGIDIARINLF